MILFRKKYFFSNFFKNLKPQSNYVNFQSYNRKTDITNRLLEIFNFVQSSLQPSEYVCPSDSGILSDYMPATPSSSDVISEEDLNTALMSFASRMNSLDKENVKLQAENEKLREDLMEKMEEGRRATFAVCDINALFNIKTFLANILIKKQSSDNRSVDGDSVGRSLDMVSDMVQEISRIDKQLSEDGSLFKSGNIDKLTNEVAHLQQEIESNNKLLSEKDCTIASLIECGILKDRELNDLRNRTCSIERNSYSTCNDAVSDSYFI